MTENQIQTPDVFSPDTQVVIKQQHKIAGALKDMLEKRPRPADDIGIRIKNTFDTVMIL